MILFSGTFYLVKGRVKEFLGTTPGCEKDCELDEQESAIVQVLEKLANKLPEIKKVKNAVFLMEFEDAKWLESSGNFKQTPTFVKIARMNYSPSDWKRFNKMRDNCEAKDNVGEKMMSKVFGLIGLGS